MEVLDQLQKLGLTLPEPPRPVASYVPALTVPNDANLVVVSGQIPMEGGKPIATGRVPAEVPIEQAASLAARCALAALAALQEELGDLERLVRVVRLDGFVACEPGFGDQPRVINGASDLLVQVLGDRGRHARAAVGVPALPLNVPVEIAFTFAAK